MSNGNNPNDDVTSPAAQCEWRLRVTNNFTSESLDYMIPLPPEVALQYNHIATTAIVAVLAKAGQILTDVTVEEGTAAQVAARGEELVGKIREFKVVGGAS